MYNIHLYIRKGKKMVALLQKYTYFYGVLDELTYICSLIIKKSLFEASFVH